MVRIPKPTMTCRPHGTKRLAYISTSGSKFVCKIAYIFKYRAVYYHKEFSWKKNFFQNKIFSPDKSLCLCGTVDHQINISQSKVKSALVKLQRYWNRNFKEKSWSHGSREKLGYATGLKFNFFIRWYVTCFFLCFSVIKI